MGAYGILYQSVDGCVGTNRGNEWLRPRRNGNDMTHRHFPVSSRHSRRGESTMHGVFIDSCMLGCLLPCMRDLQEKDIHLVNSRARRGLYPSMTNGARCVDVVQTTWDKFSTAVS